MRIGFLKIPICCPKERHFSFLGTFANRQGRQHILTLYLKLVFRLHW